MLFFFFSPSPAYIRESRVGGLAMRKLASFVPSWVLTPPPHSLFQRALSSSSFPSPSSTLTLSVYFSGPISSSPSYLVSKVPIDGLCCVLSVGFLFFPLRSRGLTPSIPEHPFLFHQEMCIALISNSFFPPFPRREDFPSLTPLDAR